MHAHNVQIYYTDNDVQIVDGDITIHNPKPKRLEQLYNLIAVESINNTVSCTQHDLSDWTNEFLQVHNFTIVDTTHVAHTPNMLDMIKSLIRGKR